MDSDFGRGKRIIQLNLTKTNFPSYLRRLMCLYKAFPLVLSPIVVSLPMLYQSDSNIVASYPPSFLLMVLGQINEDLTPWFKPALA